MNHLIISREYPPSPYSGGGIGAYVSHIAELLAGHGETVHVIGQLWPGAPLARERRLGGRLVIHRVALDEVLPDPSSGAAADPTIRQALQHSALPCRGFLWNAALLAESLIETAGVDIVEAQEYEAPAYFLMLRRRAGLGPARRVPIVVHLHTPTEFVCEANGWDQDHRDYAPLIQLERWVIGAADALLCPSHFLGRIAESHYQLERGAVDVIPYPLGDVAVSRRDESTWRNGTICYAGRLEPRKGVSEWIEAAIAVAADIPADFTLIGGDSVSSGVGSGLGSGSSGGSMRAMLRRRIPAPLRSRIQFLDAVPRRQVLAHLARARIAVVPSRWENFPYACIEAMASGLPVIVSPSGGMAEMIDDGRTGWIAAGSDARSLEAALRRALAIPSGRLAEMGAAAAASIRALCDPEKIVRQQLAFRERVIARGCRQPAEVPAPPVLVSKEPHALGDPGDNRAPVQGRTMTALEILRAAPRQQLAVIRRAVANPGYVAQWLAWHGRRMRAGLRLELLFGPETFPEVGSISTRRAELFLMTLLFGAALAVRLPNLMLMPRFEDEGIEVLWGLDIAGGKGWPLTGADPYYGPLFSYLVAAVFAVFGANILWPRVIVAIFGALTVPATYWLGRVTCGRRAGLVASLLVLVSRSLIAVSSHYGWSNSLSPFFATATLAAVCEAYTRKNARLLVAGGLLAGLTVQTHPITATIVAGMAAWSLMPSGLSSAFRRSVIGAAVGALVFAYAPVLWAAAHSGSVLGIGATRAYAFMPVASLPEYLLRLTDLCDRVWLAALDGFPFYGAVGFTFHLHRTLSLAFGVVFLTGTLWASLMAGRRRNLIAFVLLASFVLLPVFVKSFFVRYLAYLLPLVYILIGDCLARLAARGAQMAVAAALVVVITVTPLTSLPRYYRQLGKRVGTNGTFLDLRQNLRANGACRDMVFLENIEAAAGAKNDYWAQFTVESIRYVLTLDSCPFELGSAAQLLPRLGQRQIDAWLILSDQSVSAFSASFKLQRVFDVSPASPSSPELRLALYSTHLVATLGVAKK